MKAIRFHEFGDPGVLRHEDVDQPAPGAGEVRLRVAATSFNPVDGGIRGGYLQGPFPVTLPHTPGIEVAGTVDALGDGVGNVAVGDAVVAFLPMTPPAPPPSTSSRRPRSWRRRPTSIPLADAAALPMVGLTAWQALFDDAELEAGQRVLINGAGGAVGGYAVQLAKRAGAYVIATASPRSAERVAAAGADEVIDHTDHSMADAVAEPVDVLLNLARIAPEELEALAALVKDRRRRRQHGADDPDARRRGPRRARHRRLRPQRRAAALAAGRSWSTAASSASTSRSGCRWPSWPPSTPKATRASSPARSSSWSRTATNRQEPSTPRPWPSILRSPPRHMGADHRRGEHRPADPADVTTTEHDATADNRLAIGSRQPRPNPDGRCPPEDKSRARPGRD